MCVAVLIITNVVAIAILTLAEQIATPQSILLGLLVDFVVDFLHRNYLIIEIDILT